MTQIIIGNGIGAGLDDTNLVYENGLLQYVYGRVTLNTNWFLFLLPSIFFNFHHAIEISIKTLLKVKNISYPDSGQKGHKIYDLLELAVNSGVFSKEINDLIKNQELVVVLKEMDKSYLTNKYNYAGFNLQGINLRGLVDDIILTIFKEVNSILEAKIPKHALAVLNVPASSEAGFLYKFDLNKISSYTVLEIRKY